MLEEKKHLRCWIHSFPRNSNLGKRRPSLSTATPREWWQISMPHLDKRKCGQVRSENKLLTQKNRLKRRLFQVKWSEMGDSNSRHLAPKGVLNTFSARSWRFLAISYLFYLLFNALISVVSGCSRAVCGNLCGQKRFPPGFR